MTNQEKKRYLMKYKRLSLEIDREIDELAHWEAVATKVTPTYSDLPKGTSTEDRLQTTAEKIIELSAQISRDIARLVNIRETIEDAIRNVQNENHRVLLQYRYIDGLTWEQIADQMHYDRSHVCRLHGKALEEIVIKNEHK